MQIRKYLVSAIILGLWLSLWNISDPQPATAATTCQGEQSAGQMAGTGIVTVTHYGVTADISTGNPALCGAPYSASTAWTMIAGGGDFQYAQSGYHKMQGYASPVIFAEYKKDWPTYQVHKEVTTAYGTNTYSQVYDFTTGKINMKYNGTTILTTNFDPAISWTAGWKPEWEGETHDGGDDVPGTTTAPVYFSNMGIIPCRGCGWTMPSSLGVVSDSPRYGADWDIFNSKFHIWTR